MLEGTIASQTAESTPWSLGGDFEKFGGNSQEFNFIRWNASNISLLFVCNLIQMIILYLCNEMSLYRYFVFILSHAHTHPLAAGCLRQRDY